MQLEEFLRTACALPGLSGNELAVAEHVAFTHLYVPCHQNLTGQDIAFLIEKIKEQNGRVVKAVS